MRKIIISLLLLLSGIYFTNCNSTEENNTVVELDTIELLERFKNYADQHAGANSLEPLLFVYLDERGYIRCIRDEINNLANSNLSNSAFIVYNNISGQKLRRLKDFNIEYVDEENGEFRNLPTLNPISFVITGKQINHLKKLEPQVTHSYEHNKQYYDFLSFYFN